MAKQKGEQKEEIKHTIKFEEDEHINKETQKDMWSQIDDISKESSIHVTAVAYYPKDGTTYTDLTEKFLIRSVHG